MKVVPLIVTSEQVEGSVLEVRGRPYDAKVYSEHQPYLFPWLPFFAKMMASDVFVIMRNCNYSSEHNYMHRAVLKNQNITLPITKKTRRGLTCEVRGVKNCAKTLEAQLKNTYGKKTPHLYRIDPVIELIHKYDREDGFRLADFNSRFISMAAQILGYKGTILFDSPPKGRTTIERTLNRIPSFVTPQNYLYLCGEGTESYLKKEDFPYLSVVQRVSPTYRKRMAEEFPNSPLFPSFLDVLLTQEDPREYLMAAAKNLYYEILIPQKE